MDFEALITDSLRRMLEAGVFVDPLLVHTYYKRCSDYSVWEQAEAHADTVFVTRVHVQEFVGGLGVVPYSPAAMRRCLVETIMSTAIWLCQESTGTVSPRQSDVHVAFERLDEWLLINGLSTLYTAYITVAGYDFLQPIRFHQRVYESDFLEGVRHYPYTSDALDTYLLLGLAIGSVRLKSTKSGRVVQLTKTGVERLTAIRAALEKSGYLNERITLSYVYQFDRVEEWDKLCAAVWPDAEKLRRDYLNWLDIPGTENVLEIAYGTDVGLTEAGRSGGKRTTVRMTSGIPDAQSQRHSPQTMSDSVDWVKSFVERLPFDNESFDAVMGCNFLQCTDEPEALAEMTRVARPGGVVSVLQALRLDFNRPFLLEWFKPLYEQAVQRKLSPPVTRLPSVDDLTTWFRSVGLVQVECEPCHTTWVFDDSEVAVQHILRGIRFFQSELIRLPWDDQRTMIMELVDRGRDVCRKYPLSQRIVTIPAVMVRGTRPVSESR